MQKRGVRDRALRLWVVLVIGLALAGCRGQSVDPTPTPPPVESVACDQVMEWIRLRPLAKICEVDADCLIQTDHCCDQTAVNKRYARTCERTCEDRCPQDSLVGRQVQWRALCLRGACELQQQTGAPVQPPPL